MAALNLPYVTTPAATMGNVLSSSIPFFACGGAFPGSTAGGAPNGYMPQKFAISTRSANQGRSMGKIHV